MRKSIIISAADGLIVVGLLENDQVCELYVERGRESRLLGNIYRGVVMDLIPSMQAAFVDIGCEKNGFLYLKDVRPDCSDPDEIVSETAKEAWKERDITKLLRAGQEIVVQVAKEPYQNKGARLTTYLTVPGRHLVLLPHLDHIGISHRLQESRSRDRLTDSIARLRPDRRGYIIRTKSINADESSLQGEIDFLQRMWQGLRGQIATATPRQLIHRDSSLLLRICRDYYDEEVEEVIVDDAGILEEVRAISRDLQLSLQNRLHFQGGDFSLAQQYGLDRELELALRAKVWLKGGSYLLFEATEALTTIDVNSGKCVGAGEVEEMVFNINVAAVPEIVRQIRLRNISGVIIVDFIDMELPSHREQLLNILEAELKRDRIRSVLVDMTPLGLVEITRKRESQSLHEIIATPCPHCGGRGHFHLSEVDNFIKGV